MRSAYQCSRTSFRFVRFSPHVPAASTTLIGGFYLMILCFFVSFRRPSYFGHNIFHGTMEPDGCTVWSIIGLRKYVLHLLRVWFGRKATDTLLVTDAFLSRKDWTASASSSYPLESPSFSVQSLSVMLDSPEPLLDSELGGMTHSLARCGQSFGCRKPCEPTKQHTHTLKVGQMLVVWSSTLWSL